MSAGFRLLAALLFLAALPAAAQTVVIPPIGFDGPIGLAIDGGGNVFVADAGNNQVRLILAQGGYGTVEALAVANGNFKGPTGVVVDGNGNLFVTDAGNNAVKEILAAGGYATVLTLAATGNFNAPGGIAIDASGNLFIADTQSAAVKEILAAGGYATVNTLAPGNFTAPEGVAVDRSGNVFVADAGSETVKEILAAGGYTIVETVIPQATVNFQALMPTAIAIDGSENLFVASEYFEVGGLFSGHQFSEYTAAGGYATAHPIASSIAVIGVALDSSGNLFVTDSGADTVNKIPAAGGYAAVDRLDPNSVREPDGIAVDGTGNLFITDVFHVAEARLAGNTVTMATLAANGAGAIAVDASGDVFFAASGGDVLVLTREGIDTIAHFDTGPTALAIDGGGNLFVTSGISVLELLAADRYVTAETIAAANGDFNNPQGIAIDGSGNVFVADAGHGAVKEILASGGYVAVQTIAASTSLHAPFGLAIDGNGNLFVADRDINAIEEILAEGGYATVQTLAAGAFTAPDAVAVDQSGDIFVLDGTNRVLEILGPPSPLAAAILPGGRSVELGTTATVFASVVNGGSSDLSGCAPSLPAEAPAGLTLDYWPTDPTTNAIAGPSDQPVPIAAGAAQSFLLAFGDTTPLTLSGLPVPFACTGTAPAPVVPGVDTVDLTFASTPVPDIIAVAATASPGLTVHLVNQLGAFAVATSDAGAAGTLTAILDTGTATLPLTLEICQTNSGAQCINEAGPEAQTSFAANGTATYSVFLATSGPIPFAPGSSRIFVRFLDSAGNSRGSTSVAVTTD